MGWILSLFFFFSFFFFFSVILPMKERCLIKIGTGTGNTFAPIAYKWILNMGGCIINMTAGGCPHRNHRSREKACVAVRGTCLHQI